MTLLLTYAILVSTVYMVYVVSAKRGIPESLSATYYDLKEDGWLFQAVLITCGMALLPVWIEASEMRYCWLDFLACGGLMFAGAAPAFRLKLDGAVHYSAAVICCVSAVCWILAMGMYPILLWWGILGWMCYLQWGNWCWWLEIAMMGAVYTALV